MMLYSGLNILMVTCRNPVDGDSLYIRKCLTKNTGALKNIIDKKMYFEGTPYTVRED